MGTESNRMWASAAFVGVLIVIGMPLWWKTTEVYRVSLPYDKISSFNTEAHYVTTQLNVLANDERTASEIIGLIEKTFEDADIIKLKIKKIILSEELQSKLETAASEHRSVEELANAFDLEQHNTFYVVQKKSLLQDVWLANERVMFYSDDKSSSIVVEVLKQWIYQTSVLLGARSEKADAARQTRFPPSNGYHVVLSIVQPRPDAIRVDFPTKEAVEDYIGTFVDELSVLHNFTLKSQWLYLLDFDFQATEVKDKTEWGRHYAVAQDRLSLLLTKLEERAATQVSELSTINLALYATPCEKAPLAIYDSSDRMISAPVPAFMSPKWGGVVLGSPSAADCNDEVPTWQPNIRTIMGAFISHLRKLIGIVDNEYIDGAFLEPLKSVVPRKWEIDNLLRIRTLEQLTSAERTLQSLAQLLGEISNIVINDEVGALINSAVENIRVASHLLGEGKLLEAYETSLIAFLAAESAFMEPSLLSLLYFPDDQKYAIYIPLFLPIMFPVVLSLKHLILWMRGKPIHKEKTE
ncbi:hypothetical protein K1T71_011474 [Dendrolimus kikuchii]|uniref:Uncharacterized protein n=1 Tax=Dendrolimus kikuchii TaxID=765133 RepID=A0ACC1CNV8_9NEOP|nr:hypothetical protein K1T71_011474 [Dendrolimus kikuchii]